MRMWSLLRVVLLAIASLGYLANGAQAHLHISTGETLNLMLCGTGSAKSVAVELPSDPIEETEDTCCGDCAPTSVIDLAAPTDFAAIIRFADPLPTHLPAPISPRSPLWPGAPPQGPPGAHKA